MISVKRPRQPHCIDQKLLVSRDHLISALKTDVYISPPLITTCLPRHKPALCQNFKKAFEIDHVFGQKGLMVST